MRDKQGSSKLRDEIISDSDSCYRKNKIGLLLVVLVTVLLLQQNTMTKATYRRKHLIGLNSFRGSMVQQSLGCRYSLLRAHILVCKQEAENSLGMAQVF